MTTTRKRSRVTGGERENGRRERRKKIACRHLSKELLIKARGVAYNSSALPLPICSMNV
jgi:hypothetical protein